MISKKQFLCTRKFNIVEAQRKSFISVLDQALRDIDAGKTAQAEKRINEAKALWGKVKEVHGVEL